LGEEMSAGQPYWSTVAVAEAYAAMLEALALGREAARRRREAKDDDQKYDADAVRARARWEAAANSAAKEME
jgi:hypothetical protein